jgi:hypothetical protein
MAAGADETEVRKSLALAISYFPRNDTQVVGIGVISGPIIWGSSGLDAQARWEIANTWAKLGEVEKATQLMNGIEDPVFAWSETLTPDIPLEHLNALLGVAAAILSIEEHSYVRAKVAAEMSLPDKTEAQLSWALSTTNDILRAELLSGDRAVGIYTALLRAAVRLEDQKSEKMALVRMAQAALSSQEYRDLLRAGFRWYKSDTTP